MKHILKNKKGVTLLEGLIALGLLALVTAGSFGVLLSISRQASQPDIREEMALAVEKAHQQLQRYTYEGTDTSIPADIRFGLCGESSGDPFSGEHDINCLLPAICDPDSEKSSFTYEVMDSEMNITLPTNSISDNFVYTGNDSVKVQFKIKCNGFTL